jgi:hypothetical protein
MLGGSDMIAAEMEEIVDLIMGSANLPGSDQQVRGRPSNLLLWFRLGEFR